MATLYRIYRPQKFSEVVGQNHIKITLGQEVATGKIAHAYLFSGPRAVGKTTLARVLAKTLNCLERENGEYEPCDKCQMCQDITSGRGIDINEIDAASHTGVDNVRENIIAASRVAATSAKFKVFIIDEVHMLSIPAFNALLKILEEPPANVIFILCTTEVHKIPTTIISRCERFDFKLISISEIVKKLAFIADLEKIKIDKNILEAIARHSEGHMRDAESLLGQVVAIGGKEITLEEADLVIPRSDLKEALKLIEYISKKDASSAIGLVNKLIDEGIDIKRFLADLIELLRKILLIKINPALAEKIGFELGEDIELGVNQISRTQELNRIIRLLEKFLQVRKELRGSFIVQLPVEIAIAELCTQLSAAKPEALGIMPKANQAPAAIQPVSLVNSGQVHAAAVGGTLNPEIIAQKWNEVLAKVKKYNHSLSFILRVCQPRELNQNQLCLAFKYKFHKDRMSDMNIKKLVEKVLREVYDQPLTIEAIIDEGIEVKNNGTGSTSNGASYIADSPPRANQPSANNTDNPDESQAIDNIIKTFGGKVVK